MASASSAESPTTPEEAAERMEIHRLLAGLVAELDEPYRHVVYLRYVEDRDPSEIARLLDAPPGTIRWRLKEALGRLRARLDERYGSKDAWAVVLAPLARSKPGRRA